ncbi:MAG: hypothetical protein ACLFOY_18750 [Desulfatibacillaceae bacterium]
MSTAQHMDATGVGGSGCFIQTAMQSARGWLAVILLLSALIAPARPGLAWTRRRR